MSKIIINEVKNFKRFISPFSSQYESNLTNDKNLHTKKKYVLNVKISEIQDNQTLSDDIWKKINPRMQNHGTKVSKKIRESLNDEYNYNFHNLNRGIVFSATKVSFKENSLNFEFTDEDIHGNIDGGHTLSIILDNISHLDNQIARDKYVTIEIFEDLDKDQLIELASSRNTSVEVSELSLKELSNFFKPIQKILEQEQYSSDISWKQNDKKTIDGREVIALVSMFDLQIFSINQQPISTYSSKEATLRKFVKKYEHNSNQPALFPPNYDQKIPKIFELYDAIEKTFNEKVKENNMVYKSLKFAVKRNKDGSAHEHQKRITKFMKNEIDYILPSGIIYPILGAFRHLLDSDGNFSTDPILVWDEMGKVMSKSIIDQLRMQGNNPQSIGKNVNVWESLSDKIKIFKLTNT